MIYIDNKNLKNLSYKNMSKEEMDLILAAVQRRTIEKDGVYSIIVFSKNPFEVGSDGKIYEQVTENGKQ